MPDRRRNRDPVPWRYVALCLNGIDADEVTPRPPVRNVKMRTGAHAITAIARLSILLATACVYACLESVAAVPMSNPPAADFFVSSQGKDTWSGKPADPGENDGPFATLARAVGPFGRCSRRRNHLGASGSSSAAVRIFSTRPWSSAPKIRELWTRRWFMPRRRERR